MAHAVTPYAARWRFWLLAICACAFLAMLYGTFICSPFMPWCGDPGFQWTRAAKPFYISVNQVDNGGAAQKAGMRAGDEINLRQMGLPDRYPLLTILRGDPLWLSNLHYTVHRGPLSRSVVLEPAREPPTWGSWVDWIGDFVPFTLLIFAALLAIRAPGVRASRLLASFLAVMVLGEMISVEPKPFSALDLVTDVVTKICFGLSVAIFFAFTASFEPLSRLRRSITVFGIAASFAGTVFLLVWTFAWATAVLDPPRVEWSYGIGGQVLSGAEILGIVAGALATLAASGTARQCVMWATLSVSVYWIAGAIATAIAPSLHGSAFVAFNSAMGAVQICLPVGFTYAVLSRRFVDMGFFVSRAAVFTLLSIIVLGVFTLLEWALSEFVSNVSRTTSIALNIGAALLLGLSLRFIHGRAERFVDRVFFRKRHDDDKALRTFAHEAAFITDKTILLQRTAETVKEHVDANAVWVAERDDVETNDPAMVAMRAWHKPVELHRYTTSIHGEVAFPMISRGHVMGVLICDSKTTGEAYAPDEMGALCEVAHGVGSALDVLGSAHDGVQRQMLDRLSQLSGDIQELQRAVSDMRKATS